MFRYKVSIYLESGNIIYYRPLTKEILCRLKEQYEDKSKIWWYDNKDNICSEIKKVRIEAIIIKKWWQKWG